MKVSFNVFGISLSGIVEFYGVSTLLVCSNSLDTLLVLKLCQLHRYCYYKFYFLMKGKHFVW